MMAASLLETESQLKSRELLRSDCPSEIIIRVGLDGLHGIAISTDESDTQGQLLQLLSSIRPVLEAGLNRTRNDEESVAIAERTEVRI